MEHTTNSITLRGSLQELPCFSHENHGRRFLRFHLEVQRLSGAVDILPVIAEENLLAPLDPTAGNMLTVTGQIRSHNQRTEGARHLLIFVFASEIIIEDGEPVNEVLVEGPLCREPNFRKTPLGREITDLLVAVNRSYGKSDYIPCIAWGRNARYAAGFSVGSNIELWGRVQSREYTKSVGENQSEKRVAYEVSVSKLGH